MKKSVKDLGDVKGKRALVRVDINVPLDKDKNVTDDTRIQAILPTVRFLQEKGAKIILMAHLGRPQKLKEGQTLADLSLEPVAKYMSKVLGQEVKFVKSPVGEGADKELADLQDGQVALLENIRYYKAEEAKDDDMTFVCKRRIRCCSQKPHFNSKSCKTFITCSFRFVDGKRNQMLVTSIG